jgi:hypothetical protein
MLGLNKKRGKQASTPLFAEKGLFEPATVIIQPERVSWTAPEVKQYVATPKQLEKERVAMETRQAS